MRLIKVFLLAAGALVCSVADVRAVHACTALLKPIDQVIRESETVVRARVVASDPRMRTDPGRITLRVLEVLKGSYDRLFVTVTGQIRDYPSDPARRPPYDQIDCVGRVPGCGSCFAQSYKDGAQYLLLLKGGTPYWAPLSPTNEEVFGTDDPWVAWVRRRLAGRAPSPRPSPFQGEGDGSPAGSGLPVWNLGHTEVLWREIECWHVPRPHGAHRAGNSVLRSQIVISNCARAEPFHWFQGSLIR